jgi:hypothetical protein
MLQFDILVCFILKTKQWHQTGISINNNEVNKTYLCHILMVWENKLLNVFLHMKFFLLFNIDTLIFSFVKCVNWKSVALRNHYNVVLKRPYFLSWIVIVSLLLIGDKREKASKDCWRRLHTKGKFGYFLLCKTKTLWFKLLNELIMRLRIWLFGLHVREEKFLYIFIISINGHYN